MASYHISTGRLSALAVFSKEPDLTSRGESDGVGGLYVQCEDEGSLMTCGGRAVDYGALIVEAVNRYGIPDAIACDRYKIAELLDVLEREGIRCKVESRGHSYRDGSEDVRLFRRCCAEGLVVPVQSLLLRNPMSEAITTTDESGNTKLAKSSQSGRRYLARDDAAAAAILAVACGARMRRNLQIGSPLIAVC